MAQHRFTRSALVAALAFGLTLPMVGTPAQAEVLPENASDVGVYTDGTSDVMDIGTPTYTNLGPVEAAVVPGVPWTAGSMHQSIFDRDLAAGGTDYYLDRILGVTGTSGNTVLQTRGRTLYMRGGSNANFTAMGFSGTAYAGGPNNLGNFFTLTVPGQTVTEVGAQRFNAPSHARTSYTVGTTGVTAEQKKFITHDNVAVAAVTFSNPGAEAVTFTVRAASPIAVGEGDTADELMGTRTLTSGSNNGLNDTPWSTVTVRLKADGFTRDAAALVREVTVPAGGSVDLSVAGVLYGPGMPESLAEFNEYAALSPADAFRTAVTDFNRRWASDIPYIDVPNAAIEKAIVYRWWGERYNVLDANEPGHVYQFPTTIEGVNLYQNSVVLTQPMHLQDTKWIRNPYLGYGQVFNVGELSGSSALLDSPGHTSWNNHYSQYLGTAGLEAFNVHGGGADVARKFAQYFEADGIGQLEHYDGNDDLLIAYDTNYMPGNDADAISFGYPKVNATAPGARTIERPESAYVWGAFEAARQLYALAGDTSKVPGLATQADAIRDAILGRLWSTEMRMFLAGTSHGATSGGALNPLTAAERDLIPARESNLYDVYAENLIPAEDWETYVDGFRFLRYGDNFPIFPFYTANQYDKTKYGIGGSNNFSNINFTVQYRAVRSAIRHYDPEGKYLDGAYVNRLLDWMAWSIYPGGNAAIANQAEYYSNWNPTAKTYNRNNPNHVMLGNMNYIFIEDMGGIQPRSDSKIELWPIDLGYPHFMVNNLRYHGKDLTIVWDPDGTHYGLGSGYSLFIDGARKASSPTLGRFVYDPSAHAVTEQDSGLGATVVGTSGADVPTAVDTEITDARVIDYLKKVGIDLDLADENLAEGATVTAHYTQVGPRPTPWRNFHTPGWGTSSMNYTPGAIATTERPVSTGAVVDGITINEPYWGNHGTTDATGWVELDFGRTITADTVKVFFVSDRQAGGYSQPLKYTVQVPDGAGGWTNVPDTFKSPKIPSPKLNEAQFDAQTLSKLRIGFTNQPGKYTAITEIQVFDTGRETPAVVNDAPVVTAVADRTRDGNISTALVATVVDDGVPDDQDLTYGWEVVAKPEGAGVILSAPSQLSTTVTGTVAGSYTLRFWAFDGELRTTKDVTVELAAKEMSAEFGSSATITTAATAAWENHTRVNAPTTPTSSAPGAGQGWGNWGQTANGSSLERQAWIQYTWDSPLLLASTDIYWYDDNGGTRTPTADGWVIETSTDGTTWTEVTLADGDTYAGALTKNAYNHLDFEPVTASMIRIRVFKLPSGAGGTGVLRWRVNGDTVDSVAEPVIIRTKTGVVPELPATLDVVFSSGARGELPFTWQPITADMVAETNVEPFVVYGTNSVYGLLAEAQVYVRPELSEGGISIQGAETFEQAVDVGELPYLPETVLVSYNDGSKDNQAIGVEWDFDPAVVETPGIYLIHGDLVLPWYVSSSGTVATTLKLTVGEPPVPTSLTVTTPPTKTSYTVGEALDLAGLVTTVGYEGGTTRAADTSELAVTGYDPQAVGPQTVTLTLVENEVTLTATFAVTVKAAPSPSPSVTPTVTPPPAGTDHYTIPGFHNVNGRWWWTQCEPYSKTVRCFTEIWATQVTQVNGQFVRVTGWYFNSLTYLPLMTKADWGTSHLANAGEYTIGGRRWRTECGTPLTGRDGCRSYIWAHYITSTAKPEGGYAYAWTQGWLLNNMVRFKVA